MTFKSAESYLQHLFRLGFELLEDKNTKFDKKFTLV